MWESWVFSVCGLFVFQLLEKIKQVNFTLQKSKVLFDANGDPLTGYDLVMWKWTGPTWSFDVIGSFLQKPDRLNINRDGFVWHTKDNQVPQHLSCILGKEWPQESRAVAPNGDFLSITNKTNLPLFLKLDPA